MAVGMPTSHREGIDVFEVLVYHWEEDTSIAHPLTQAIPPSLASPHRSKRVHATQRRTLTPQDVIHYEQITTHYVTLQSTTANHSKAP